MPEIPIGPFQLPASVVVAAAVAMTYLMVISRRGRGFSLLDGLVLIALMAIVTAGTIPVLGVTESRARAALLRQTLRTLRSQISLYKAEHEGQLPILFEGTLPQLTHATSAKGIPGPQGKLYPCGPYFRYGLPPNPMTGVATVTPIDESPPTAASPVGGWLYDQQTGRIFADAEGFLRE